MGVVTVTALMCDGAQRQPRGKELMPSPIDPQSPHVSARRASEVTVKRPAKVHGMNSNLPRDAGEQHCVVAEPCAQTLLGSLDPARAPVGRGRAPLEHSDEEEDQLLDG